MLSHRLSRSVSLMCHAQPSLVMTTPDSFLNKQGSFRKIQLGKFVGTTASRKVGFLVISAASMTSPPILRKADQNPKVP